MKNKVNDIPEDDFLIEMTDEDGNTFYYVEEMIIPVGEENFALLVEVKPEDDDDEECECHHGHKHGQGCCHDDEECNHEHKHGGCCHDEDECDCGCDDDDVIIAKIVVNEDGEEEYVEPTDEEFELVQQAYEKLMDEEE
ncbi:MAG: DUF1292 domain-containing protein [Selenomonadaceae bacterium]|nr:DUF1292 domain-containing protein [Selenomonadaceae bacterium]